MIKIDWSRAYRGRTTLGRFMSKIDRRSADGCWLWTGAVTDMGYGSFRVQQSAYLAHRAMFMLWYGTTPTELDHLCRVPRCVNPDHLEPVTHHENLLRGNSITAVAARATHCVNGHPWSAENTSRTTGGSRRCKACHRAAERTRQQKRRVTA